MDIALNRPFPYKLWRLWCRSLRRKLSPSEQKKLDRLLDRRHPGRLIESEPLPHRRFVRE